jgi:hypothetical protein
MVTGSAPLDKATTSADIPEADRGPRYWLSGDAAARRNLRSKE